MASPSSRPSRSSRATSPSSRPSSSSRATSPPSSSRAARPSSRAVQLVAGRQRVEPAAERVQVLARGEAAELVAGGERFEPLAQGVELVAPGDRAPRLGELAPQRLQVVARRDRLAERRDGVADRVEVALAGPAVGERRELLADRLQIGVADAAGAQRLERALQVDELAARHRAVAQLVDAAAEVLERRVGLVQRGDLAAQLVQLVAAGQAVEAAAQLVEPAEIVAELVAALRQRVDAAAELLELVALGEAVDHATQLVDLGLIRGTPLFDAAAQLLDVRMALAQLVDLGAQLVDAALRPAREDVQALADDRHLLARRRLLGDDRLELVPQRRQVRAVARLEPVDLRAQRGQLGAQCDDRLVLVAGVGGQLLAQRLERRDGLRVAGADRLQLGAQLGLRRAQRLQLGAQRAGGLGPADGLLAQLVGDRAQGVEPRAGLLALALQLLEPAAVVAGQRLALVAVDGRLADALAQPLGVALERVDPLERRGQLGTGALQLAVVLALDAGECLAQLGAGGVRLLAVACDPLQERGLACIGVTGALVAQALGLGGAGRLQGGEPLLELGARVGGLGQRGGQARLGVGAGLAALLLEPLDAAGERAAVRGRLLAAGGVVGAGLLEPLQALEQRGVGRAAASAGLQGRAGGLRLALGDLGAGLAGLRLAHGLLDLARQLAGDPLELVDPLHRRQQPGDDRGGVVEVVDRLALDAGVRVGDRLLALGVLAGALLLAADQLVLDPGGRAERAEGDERPRRAPALPGLRLGVERGAQRADDDRVLLAHAQQHQVHRQLERQVLEEEREVEALVQLDRDEDRLERELLVARGVARGRLDERAGVRRVAGGEEAAPLLGVLAQLAGEQAVEERHAERVGRLAAEQQLGGLGPLRDGALAVGEDEPAADDLLEQTVQRVVRDRLLGAGGGGEGAAGGGV